MPRKKLLAVSLGLIYMLGGLFSNVSAVEIIAHRGATVDAPENTVIAMQLGFEQQAEAAFHPQR